MYYYTFKELFEEQSKRVLSKDYNLIPKYEKLDQIESAPNIETLAHTVTNVIPDFVTDNFTYLNTMFYRLVNKWINNDIYYCWSKKELTDDEKIERLRRLLDKFNDTYGEYVDLIKRYEALTTSDIPSYVESSTETRFNDTPLADADYSAEQFTSNVSKIVSKTGVDTIERYKAVKEVIEDVYEKWERNFIAFQYILD